MGTHESAAPWTVPEARYTKKPRVRRVLLSSTLGTAMEWYDLYLYSAASALVIGPLFFPGGSSSARQLAVFATYTAGFVARPLGGVVFGHIGDRAGRKAALVITMLTMGLATFGVGLLPGYRQAGLLAPVLLVTLRLAQGIGIGGEWGGAVLLAAENAPPGRRTLYSSWPAAGFPVGLLASTFAFSVISYQGADGSISWQWRIPFLISILLVAVGVFVRSRAAETPEFAAVVDQAELARVPVLEALRRRPLPVLAGAFTALGTGMIVTTYSVYLVAWAAHDGPVARTAVLDGLMIGAAVECLLIPVFAALADRVGSHRVIFSGFVVCGLMIFPAANWLSSGNLALTALVFVVALGIGHAAVYGSLAGLLVAMFPTRSRYSGLAVTYQIGSTTSSFGPLIAAAMVGGSRDTFPVTIMFLAVTVVSCVAVLLAPKSMAVSKSSESD
jgi:MFS transporter, MHS family, shikimate and dehydroshikimate transport protein